ncbi:MAG: hypothetical protein IJY59_02000 [Bacteroidaceae bacterium]|nr:hypothetical protein [Bacteroidaceae bacterium]
MELKLIRHWPKATYTIGRLYIDGKYFCDTLEDRVVDVNRNGTFDGAEKKVYAESAIPYGLYRIEYTHSPRFGRKLPRLINVPSFTGILIHPGNTAKDSAGCILVGKNTKVSKLTQSANTSRNLNKLIDAAIKNGETVTIEIV